jgi:hypothetical protein
MRPLQQHFIDNQGGPMTLAEAHKHYKFMPSPDGEAGVYWMLGGMGWIPCTPEQNAFLDAKANEGKQVPMASLYKQRGGRYGSYKAFDIFVVEGVR